MRLKVTAFFSEVSLSILLQQTIKIFDRPEIDDIDFNNDLQVHKDDDDNNTVGFSELHKFANQLANTPGTRHIKKHSRELYKTYPLDSRPSNLPLLKGT